VRENLVLDSLIYLEPVERFLDRSNVMAFRSFGDSVSSKSSGPVEDDSVARVAG